MYFRYMFSDVRIVSFSRREIIIFSKGEGRVEKS